MIPVKKRNGLSEFAKSKVSRLLVTATFAQPGNMDETAHRAKLGIETKHLKSEGIKCIL
jgi:hypothetical protein